jgi:hypothetical protein
VCHFDLPNQYWSLTNNALAKMKRREWAKSSKVEVANNENLPEETHARNFSTITEHCTSFSQNEHSPDKPGDLWDAGNQWTNQHVGIIPMDRKRWQLPNDPAVVSQRTSLESDPMDVFPETLFEGGR